MDVPFQVISSQAVRAELEELHRRAAQAGSREHFLGALRDIRDKLQTAPLDFGEHLYTLPALGLAVRAGVVPPLIVHFAVHETKRLVIVQKIVPLTGHGLDVAPD